MRRILLEEAAFKVCEQSSVSPLIFQLPPTKGRKQLEDRQNSTVNMYPANIQCEKVQINGREEITTYFITPKENTSVKSIIFYIHGAGWVFGSFHTHEKLVRELSARTNSLIVFPEYTRSPEVRCPTAIHQCYYLLCRLPQLIGKKYPNIDFRTLTVAGDSVGGNMAIAMTLLAKEKCGPKIHKQLLYYPVTNACFQTESYHRFARGYYPYRAGMEWFWNQYLPVLKQRSHILSSPLRASVHQLKSLPDAMIINGEADVLKDEGEAYAKKLMRAGVNVTAVQIQGTIHDFVMLNVLDLTNACRTAMNLSTDWICQKNAVLLDSR